MKNRKFLSLFTILILSGVFFGYNQLTPSSQVPPSIVVGLPHDYNPFEVIAPYSGPHPSKITRPAETFNFPIKLGETGPVKPLFAGPLEYPFLCRTFESGLGQPLVDNQRGEGIEVFKLTPAGKRTSEVTGYSKDCSVPSRAFYMYARENDEYFYPLREANNDIEKITVNGRSIDFIVRVETGTINRHPYIIYALKGTNGTLEKPDPENWNKRLIYQFKGGVGIGKRQGKLNIKKLLARRKLQLRKGYAIVHSTANQTSSHYNIWLAEDTALRVKQQFSALYGKADYTFGFGGSGGAIQQYLLAQNSPGIIDAALTLYSFPDMLSQTTYIMDCELLEYFFDVTDADNEKWSRWENRRILEGLNAKNDWFNRYALANAASDILHFKMPDFSMGMTECVNSWRGLTPLVLNPKFPVFPERASKNVQSVTQLSYWNNLKTFYGTDADGYARVTWDNIGVQYGLNALRGNQISLETFLKLNANIGGWKPGREMQEENFWFFTNNILPAGFSIWSHQNTTSHNSNTLDNPAPRTQGDIKAIRAAWLSGQIFLGKLDIPVLDLRHYLDEQLNMHHSFASFSARSRMIREQGHADNQVIWMTQKPHTPIPEALLLLEQWVSNISRAPEKSLAENRPGEAIDKCFNAKGTLIAEGNTVWDGPWNNKEPGKCMSTYPSYQTSRMIAGDSIAGDIFKCQLQPVQLAIKTGLYNPVDMTAQQGILEKIFPQGVCDYSKPDYARPHELIQ